MKLPTEPGLYPELSREDYDRLERTNMSTLLELKKSAFRYRRKLTAEHIETDPMRVGSATHVAALEPERFRSKWAVWDGGSRRGKEWEKFKAQHEGLGILTADQYEEVQNIAKAVLSDEHAAKYLRGGMAEVTALWEVDGIKCKGRPDLSSHEADVMVDLKTTRDASPTAFAKACWNLSYHTRAAFYVDGEALATGRPPKRYVIVAVENQEPYAVQVYRLPEHILEVGREEYRTLLERLAWCRKENRWPGYADGELELELPAWAATTANNDDDDVSGMGLELDHTAAAQG